MNSTRRTRAFNGANSDASSSSSKSSDETPPDLLVPVGRAVRTPRSEPSSTKVIDRVQGLAQKLHNRTLGAQSAVAQRLTWRLHQAVTRRVDPTITIEVAGRQLRAPLSHQLPFYRRWHPRWDGNIGVLAALVSEYEPGGTMIDIGANIGDSAAIARSRAPELPILCVEGNPRFASLLRTNALALGDVEIAAPVALGDTNETVQGSFVETAGTAALEASSGGSPVDLLTLDRLLAEHHPRFSRPALLKSDTDGYEARILAGATLTLESAKPVLLLEYEPEMLDKNGIGGLHMLRRLRELGYQATLVYDSMGVPLCRASLENETLLTDLDRYAREKLIYLDVAVFPQGAEELAESLYARETAE